MHTENSIVDFVSTFLEKSCGYTINRVSKNSERGDDIAATAPNGDFLFIECKGSVSRSGNELDAWQSSAMALFGAVKETEQLRPQHRHGIAVPDTPSYRQCLEPLESFFFRQGITLFWVQGNGAVLTVDTRFQIAQLSMPQTTI